MTQEEKRLLLKDLSARLPYGVIAYASEINKNGIITDVNIPYHVVNLTFDNDDGKYELVPLFDIKPYLRPMSSMTSDERFEHDELQHFYTHGLDFNVDEVDWLNAHHFDYRGLIPMGLALEAPDGMYKK